MPNPQKEMPSLLLRWEDEMGANNKGRRVRSSPLSSLWRTPSMCALSGCALGRGCGRQGQNPPGRVRALPRPKGQQSASGSGASQASCVETHPSRVPGNLSPGRGSLFTCGKSAHMKLHVEGSQAEWAARGSQPWGRRPGGAMHLPLGAGPWDVSASSP